jgi:small basic protein
MRPSFISITDFMSAAQVQTMLDVLVSLRIDRFKHLLGVGVMTSYKAINGIPSRLGESFPKPEDIAGIFSNHVLALNILHYVDYKGIDIFSSLVTATKLAGPNLQAIQLDMVWPDPGEIIAFREAYPDIRIIIQINTKAFERIGEDPSELVIALAEYGDSVDYVLLDRSMGKGVAMDPKTMFPYLRVLDGLYGLVVAGGLGPNTFRLAKPIVDVFPDVSLDAQGQLRPSGSYYDPIDWDMAIRYFVESAGMFR